jgi:hypothetical protein
VVILDRGKQLSVGLAVNLLQIGPSQGLILEQVGKRGATFNGIVLARVPPENQSAMMVPGKGQKPLGSCIVQKTSLIAEQDPAGGFLLQPGIDF